MVRTITNRQLMLAAWEAARRAADRFGGRPALYVQEALRMAWQFADETDRLISLIGNYQRALDNHDLWSIDELYYMNRVRDLEDRLSDILAVFQGVEVHHRIAA